jgi:hypothetical protein
MVNRIEDTLYPEGSPPIPVFRHRAPPAAPESYVRQIKGWACQNPVPCLVTAFTVGALVAWFVKRK